MHNLIAFFRRFRIFMLFVLLQIFALSTYFTSLSFPRSQYISSASAVSSSILEGKNSITKYWNLGENNKFLQEENIRLRKKIASSFIRLNSKLVKIEDTLYQQQYEYISGQIINSSCSKRNNFFTLNIGRKQGVKRGMGVFSDKGIVGVIHNVSQHYSVIKSVLTESINVDVIIESSGAFGLLKWDGRDSRRGSISGISNDMKIKKWSNIVTRGGSGIFPRGLMVGKIERLKTIEGKPLWDVTFIYSEDYRKIQNVYVIKNLLREEQEKLEKEIPEDKVE
jgi:rod shape-determining protein MreC